MRGFKVAITFGNAAFGDGDNAYTRDTETARILRNIADRLEAGAYTEPMSGAVLDSNGNAVARFFESNRV